MARKLRAGASGQTKPIEGDAPAKKRGRPAKAPEPQVSASDEQKREAMERLIDADKHRLDAKAKFDQAHSRYRSEFKQTTKITGFTKEAVSWYMRSRNAEPHEIDAEMRDRARIAAFMNMASGFQSTFNFSVNDPAPTNAPTDDLKAANEQGYMAGDTDRPQANPYPEGSPRCVAWDAGYMQRQVEIAKGMGNGSAEAHA